MPKRPRRPISRRDRPPLNLVRPQAGPLPPPRLEEDDLLNEMSLEELAEVMPAELLDLIAGEPTPEKLAMIESVIAGFEAEIAEFDEFDENLYDPDVAPDPEEWLALDEMERIDAALVYHDFMGFEAGSPKLHAGLHATVETQTAMGDVSPAGATLRRLVDEGLERHDAIHAIGAILVVILADLVREGATGESNERYAAELNELTAAKWLAGEYTDEPDGKQPRRLAPARRRKRRR